MRARFLAATLVLVVAVAGCVTDAPAPAPTTATPPTTTPEPTAGTPPTGEPTAAELLFNESRALASAREQVLREDGSVRYRVPGTPGNAEAAAIIARDLREAGFEVEYDHFNATYGCERTPMHNVVGVLPGATDRTLYLAAHYDTRPIAEKDPDAERRDEPIQGAVDGAGAVGVVLELARALSNRSLDATLVLLFFDGEDGGGYEGNACTDWILGSTSYAANLSAEDVARAEGLVLLDLIGEAGARFPKEGFSREGAASAAQTNAIWATADALGYGERFVDEDGPFITDDHVPFHRRGIATTDIIDLRPPPGVFAYYHHTHEDDVDKLDAGVMGQVGRTVERWVLTTYASSAP